MMLATAINPARRRDAGFTLAEMLVALALFGMISALLAAVIQLIARLDGASRRQGEAIEQVVAAQNLLRSRIEQLRALIDVRGLGDTIAMVGRRDEITFTAPGFAANGAHQLQAIRLRRTNRGQLVLYTAPLLAGNDIRLPSVEGWDAAPLLEGVQWMDIAYFGADWLTGRDLWQDSWQNRAQPPKLVRVRLGFAEGDSRSWPVLMVRPMSGVRLTCQDGRKSLDCGEAQ
ncbi:prepilin-type N-terminal cleavage/methylation domain-containing protein [Novosphingobium sp.]|uniref:PulJ/GspJ family protein n=1 Tax=Novosphingobium sp. TaxID=1874826 RepID=UPI00261541C1|nr:prepilin-type N-terminal cleavage/methylation domain-containing protein [Novosphingobium sp.]